MDIDEIRAGMDRLAEGAWMRDLPFPALDGVAFKVRGLFNPDAARIREALIAELPEERRAKVAGEDAEAVLVAILSGAVLQDWNLTRGGAPLPFTPAQAEALLTDPKIGEVMRAGVLYAAQNVARKGVAALEADAKN